MLQLKNIKKDYITGELTVNALKGIDLSFRESEFVSILGPSGCGKTTMLNIIGGLDQYSDGDLIINGTSTKAFKDRDWDGYRNHSIGFVFQSYNLIPHQTVLQNVELALTLSGVSKTERKEKAKKALESVGLAEQLKKKPSELSGGQMQRVAIARAIVNNPDIILADEPTGALDSETSVAVMEILKEISKERLVIMVTHNPELAEKYSTRIVKMLDGIITSDSNPPSSEEIEVADTQVKENKNRKKEKKPSMSFVTSFGLSLKNLFTKKGRTALTSFAGSIGIIGIALIFAVSNGMTTYIDTVQEETLSSYPIVLEEQHMDLATLMETFMDSAASETEHSNDAVYQKPALYDFVNAMNSIESRENDLEAFKKYIEAERAKESEDNKLKEAINGIQYTYNTDMLIYTENIDGEIILSDTEELMSEILMKFFARNMTDKENTQTDSSGGVFSSLMQSPMSTGLWQEILSGDNGNPVNDMLYNQYDLVYGTWPTQYNEIILVLDENNELDDITLYALGLKSKEDIDTIVDSAINKTELIYKGDSWSYEEICNMEFRTILNSNCYTLDKNTGLYHDLRESPTGLKMLYENAIPLKVSGIIRPKEDALSSMLSGSIGYTRLLTEYIVKQSEGDEAIEAQLSSPHVDIFTGLPFKESTGNLTLEEKQTEFLRYVSELDTAGKAKAYKEIISIPKEDFLNDQVKSAMDGVSIDTIKEQLKGTLIKEMGMDETEIDEFFTSMTEDDLKGLYEEFFREGIKLQYAQSALAGVIGLSDAQLSKMLDNSLNSYTIEQYAVYYDEILVFSDSTYEDNLKTLGYIDLDKPSTINLYASSFENKDIIEETIENYNSGVDELSKITYTDYVGLMMSSVTTIINAITYVLIGFVAVSLIVSSIMIGVITLISVQERTKEIGILRAIGASKKNVSSMFNAETVIIGFTSGTLGVVITYVLCIPINIVLHYFTGIGNLSAYLPLPVALILISISVLLTLIAGIIPSRSAAKKDPVVALRTE